MRIGIFGGTFNPPHKGHMLIAQSALDEAELSKIIFVPCGNPPHKDDTDIADAKHRFNMVKLAISGNPFFDISDIEVRASSPSYTAKLLESLEALYPDNTLCFIMGADSLFQMEEWYHPELIFKRAEIIVALRGGYDNSKITDTIRDYKQKYNARIRTLNMPEIELSASSVRERLKKGENVQDMLSGSVVQYIEKNGIYGV